MQFECSKTDCQAEACPSAYASSLSRRPDDGRQRLDGGFAGRTEAIQGGRQPDGTRLRPYNWILASLGLQALHHCED
jgi:hypothetical protein